MSQNWREALKTHLAAFAHAVESNPPKDVRVPSSVLIAITHNPETGEDELLLTKRPLTVATHKGQVCFPGGIFEPTDSDLLHTALREAEEEVGIRAGDVQILGRLSPVRTRFDVWILPWVGVIPEKYPYLVNAGEVDKLLFLPVGRLLDEGLQEVSVRVESYQIKSQGLWLGEELVWGATAQMLAELRSVLFLANRGGDGGKG